MKPVYELTTCPIKGVRYSDEYRFCPMKLVEPYREGDGFCIGAECMAFIQCDTTKGVCGMIPSIHIFLGAIK